MSPSTKRTLVTGTGWRNADGSSRASLIRRHVRVGSTVVLRNDADPSPESHGVAVFIRVPRWLGLRGTQDAKIGFLDAASALGLSAKLNQVPELSAKVDSLHAPPDKDDPRVGLTFEDS